MQRALQILFIAVGLGAFAVAYGFFLEQPWALSIYPWESKRLSNIFISSIFAAIGAPILWMGVTREWAAVAGGAMNLGVTFLGIGWVSMAASFSQPPPRPEVRTFAVVCIALFLACIAQFVLTSKLPMRDARKTPRPVVVSFEIFAVLLLILGFVLITERGNVFPWPLTRPHNIFYGWIFVGAALYFIYGSFVPKWGNAQGQLAGFLAYDLVLIVPYIKHFEKVPDNLRPNLIVYTAVLVYSGFLAIYYLVIDKRYRIGSSPDALTL